MVILTTQTSIKERNRHLRERHIAKELSRGWWMMVIVSHSCVKHHEIYDTLKKLSDLNVRATGTVRLNRTGSTSEF
ncbi:hypothetical protein T01_16206 [Trichinella spiralis]|uniref:Uncharacterized protein n=1 Tax=Trichinella spiralis TaxID=6334 RepID=A0A0V1APB9_TRISP|nr:hypothetical protein T01_16206 [Trichinella spiralis]